MPILYDPRGNEFQGSLDTVGGQTVTDARTASATLGSLNAELVMDIQGKAVATFDIRTGACAATLSFEGTLDGTNYIALPGINVLTEAPLTAVVISTTHGAIYEVGCTGFRRVRVRISAYTSGTVVVTGRATVSDYAIYAKPFPTNLCVTAVAAVNTGLTATLPAAGAGLYHYITRVQLVKNYSVVGVAGTANNVTTTNLPGNPVWTTEQLASAAGTCVTVVDENFTGNPLKCTAANTNTTFVAPVQLQTIWRWNVYYYVGA